MQANLLEIKRYDGEGYRPLIDFGAWRVAVLRWEASMQPERIETMERHTQTDEVFVLLAGQATLVLGGNTNVVEGVFAKIMEASNLYNVRQGTWHTVLLSQDATILIVEERNTGEANTEYCELPAKYRSEIIALD